MRRRLMLAIALVIALSRSAAGGGPRPVPDGHVRVAAVQCYPRMGQIAYNRKLLTALVERAAQWRARIVVLPECAVQGYMDPGRDRGWSAKPKGEGDVPVRKVAETVPGPSTRHFAALAKRLGIYLTVPLIEAADGRFHNAQVLVDPQGKIILHHRKQSLWPPGDAAWAAPGHRPIQVADTPFGRLGLMICYDVHKLPKLLKAARADIVLYSVGWYGPNTDSWFTDILPRRYIVPNHFTIVAANWSADRGATGWPGIGHSCVIRHDGKVLAMARRTRGVEIVVADVPIRQPAAK